MENIAHYFQTFASSGLVDPKVIGNSLWLIIALPLLGAFFSGVFGKVIGRQNVHLIAVGAIAGSFLLSLLTFITINDPSTDYAVAGDVAGWFHAGTFNVRLAFSADHLSGSMLLVITGIGLLIHIYSTEYMSHDAGYWRFFAYLNLFVASMLTLVLADSLPLMFVGWEGVGMCSYLLIGFWYEDPQKAYAGRKAFITNRIGDFGFLLASFLLVLTLDSMTKLPNSKFALSAGPTDFNSKLQTKGTLAFTTLEHAAKTLPNIMKDPIADGPLKGFEYGNVLTAILLLMMLGAAGKSAQIPLYVWLPDAMAGPTPVSALIHAATMVTSGIYLFCRISYLLVLSPTAMATVALIGGSTAFVAALIAFSQKGLKKVLAYSTVSQLGFMFLGIGSGIFWAAFLHVVTHAFFKACLFLGAGSVMHGNAEEEDITKLGGLRKEMPVTWATFFVATMAITGIIPLSGFFSKDSILHAAHANEIPAMPHALHIAWILGTLSALGTAFYMMRMYFVAFEGERSKDAKAAHAHESAPAMTVPLVFLAIGSVLLVSHGIPIMHVERNGHEVTQSLMENFLDPVFQTTNQLIESQGTIKIEPEEGVPWGVYLQAWIIALLGGGIAFFLYRIYFPSRKGQPLPGALEALRKLSWNKFYVDEFYDLAFISPIRAGAKALHKIFDEIIIDGIFVRGSAWLTARTGAALRYMQSGDAQSYAAVMAIALAGGLIWVLMKVMP